MGVRDPEDFLNKKKKDKRKHKKSSKSKAFNFYSGKPDVENCYGWSRTMTNKDLDTREGFDISMFIVNLTTVIQDYSEINNTLRIDIWLVLVLNVSSVLFAGLDDGASLEPEGDGDRHRD